MECHICIYWTPEAGCAHYGPETNLGVKNKGRKHKAGADSDLSGISNAKSTIVHLTRPITSMSPKGKASGRFDKKKWTKRVRGYFKNAKQIK